MYTSMFQGSGGPLLEPAGAADPRVLQSDGEQSPSHAQPCAPGPKTGWTCASAYLCANMKQVPHAMRY